MDIFFKALVGIAIGVSVVAVCDIISRSNIVQKIKEAIKEALFQKKNAERETEDKEEWEAFNAIVKEKQEKSVSVEVFFRNAGKEKVSGTSVDAFFGDAVKEKINGASVETFVGHARKEEVILEADEVADDIHEGDWISLLD